MTPSPAADPAPAGPVDVLLLALVYPLLLLFNGSGQNLYLLVLAVLLIAVLLLRVVRRGAEAGALHWPRGVLAALMAGYLLWLAANSLWSTWPHISALHVWVLGALPGLYLLWTGIGSARGWRMLWLGLSLAVAAIAVWGLAEYAVTQQRVRGPFEDFNAYGAVFYLFFFPALFGYLSLRQGETPGFWRLRAYEAFFALSLSALFATYSRGAIGAWVLIAPLALLAAVLGHGRRAAGGLITVALIAGLCFAAVSAYPEQTITRNVTHLSQDHSTGSRLLMWQAAWEIYRDHPWLGTGTGTYKLHYSYYRSPRETGSSGDLAHNDYLQFLLEGGPVLLGLLLGLLAATVTLTWRHLRAARRHRASAQPARAARHLEALGLCLGVLGLFAHAAVNFIFYVAPLSAAAGLFLAEAWRRLGERGYHRLPLGAGKRSATLLAGGLLLLPVSALALDGVIAAIYLRQIDLPVIDRLTDNPQRAYKLAYVFSVLRPANPLPTTALAQHDMAQATGAAGGIPAMSAGFALADLLSLIRHRTVSPFAYEALGVLLTHYPELAAELPPGLPADPEQLFRLAVHYTPYEPQGYLRLADHYQAAGQPQKAYDLLVNQAIPRFDVPAQNGRARQEILSRAIELAGSLGHEDDAKALARIELRMD